MKISASLLQAITLGVTVTALTASTTSCEKEKIKQTQENVDDQKSGESDPRPSECPACGMG